MKQITHLQQLSRAVIIAFIALLMTTAGLVLLRTQARAQSRTRKRDVASINAPDSTIINSDITSNTTWDLAHSPYLVQTDVTVNPSVTLTIDPGVQVIFDQYDTLDVQGTLTAAGTVTQPITFTGSTQTAGWWGSLHVEGIDADHINSGSSLSYVTVEYAGYSNDDLDLDYAHVAISHSHFNHSSQDGIYGGTGGVADISDSSFSNNAGYAVYFYDGSVNPSLARLSASSNGTNGVAFGYGSMSGAHTWAYTGIPYYVSGDLTVAPSASLTVDPGVETRFEQYNGLDVQGTLTADGTAAQPIVFTASTQQPQPGWWASLYIEGPDANHINSGSSLSYVTVEYAGYSSDDLDLDYAHVAISHSHFNHSSRDGIYGGTGGVADISDSSFSNNTGYAVYFYDGSVNPSLARLSASGNGTNGVAFGSGSMSGAHTWAYTGIPYYVSGDLTVAPSASLTVDPGVETRFEQYNGLDAQGTLTAEGTTTQPITFTGSTQTPGWWSGIQVEGTVDNPNINSKFDHVTIEDAGYGPASLGVDFGQVSVTNSILRDSTTDGLYASPSSGASTLEFSQITGILGYGVDNGNDAVPLLADNNWWGNANGPTLDNTCNPGGSGTRVTGNVEIHPFLTSPSGTSTTLAVSDARILTASPVRWYIPADGVSRAWVTLTLTDGSGNPLPGRVVNLDSGLGNVVDGGITDALGQTHAYVTSDTPGEAVLTPSLDYNGTCEVARAGTSKITFTSVTNSLDVFPNAQAPYMNDDIQVNPLPVTRGVPTTISAVFTNPNTFPITVTATFGFAQEGIGLTFGPLGEKSVRIPAKGNGTAQIAWTPVISGHYCVQVEYSAQAATGAGKQPLYSGFSQRNLDVAPAHLHTFHQRTTLQKARNATNAISNAQTVLSLATSPADVSGFFIPNYLFSQILDFNFSTWGKATNALAGDPPRADYRTIATLQHFTFTPAQAGGGVSQARADAANALMASALDLTAKLNAAEISLDRYSGAAEADDLDWSSLQASTYLYYSNLAAVAMQTTADKLDTMISVLQTDGVPDRVNTPAEIQAYQDRLSTQGFNSTELQAAQVLQLSSDDIEAIRQERITIDPTLCSGSVYDLLQQMSASLREAGNALLESSPVDQIGSAAGIQAQQTPASAPLNLIRAYGESYPVVIRNPQNSAAVVQLQVRPVDMPAGWGASITPITATLSAGQVLTATLTINPTSASVQGMHPRVAVEGYINNQLIGGVVQDVLVPDYQPFDGKLRVYLPLTSDQATP